MLHKIKMHEVTWIVNATILELWKFYAQATMHKSLVDHVCTTMRFNENASKLSECAYVDADEDADGSPVVILYIDFKNKLMDSHHLHE